jgi:hypothetical protein
MSKLLLNLRHVPDDESDDVRALLESHRIAWYETRPNRWGFSAGAIWVSDDAEVPEAKRLMAVYQAQRRAQAREELELARREGRAPTFWTVLRDEPARVLLTVLGILFMLGLVALPALLIRY